MEEVAALILSKLTTQWGTRGTEQMWADHLKQPVELVAQAIDHLVLSGQARVGASIFEQDQFTLTRVS